jgi:prepilin signal peptidase PulO-like enzyme (type II secretory pathway)
MIDLLLAALIFVEGISIGSFLNVVILRFIQGREIVVGRSSCPHCGHVLTWWELLPVVSFLALRGQCVHCRQPISWQYPFIELITGLLFVAVFIPFPGSVISLTERILLAVIISFLLILFMIDFLTFYLPDIFVGLLTLTSVILIMFRDHRLTWDTFLGLLIGAGFLFSLWVVTRGRGIGLGDVKLMIPLGALFGVIGTVTLLFLAFLSGGFVGLLLLMTRRASLKTAVPFGPYLTGVALLLLVMPDLPARLFALLFG